MHTGVATDLLVLAGRREAIDSVHGATGNVSLCDTYEYKFFWFALEPTARNITESNNAPEVDTTRNGEKPVHCPHH